MDLIKENIIHKALQHGFSGVGFAKAERLEKAGDKLQEWLAEEKNGKMQYMENHFEKRIDPRLLHPGTKTIISLTYNYYQPEIENTDTKGKVSMYAYGTDYHHLIKDKIKLLVAELGEGIADEIKVRYFTDSAPVMEREWAMRAGLGWIGKNTLLIHPKKGSYFFLAEILTDLEIETDDPIRDHCGTCTRCIDACPTQAIEAEGYRLDASRCISYLTIELKDPEIPAEFKGKMENWIFGCDICQQVCPWNRFSNPTTEQEFFPEPLFGEMMESNWENLSEPIFNELFDRSPVKRTGYENFIRNIEFIKG